ncbi:hypothetical protein [Streptomyces sp. NPDC056479]|uniref:hypothetical protein n=1 Tax=unclassified Streptomyces TaxID=2593676 RepID=UPI00369D431D
MAGIDRIERRLEEPPFRLPADTFDDLQSRIGKLLASHRSTLISEALSGASRLLEVLTVLALAPLEVAGRPRAAARVSSE